MNQLLLEAFRHSAWATNTLITTFKHLPATELDRPARGFGSLIETLNHLVLSDASYVTTLTGEPPAWPKSQTADLDELKSRADDTAARWERLLSAPFDGQRLLYLDQGTYVCHASVVVVQALHHAVAHREQVRGGLADIGVKTQDLQPWEYGLATGRAWWQTASDSGA